MIKQTIRNGWYIWEPNYFSTQQAERCFSYFYDRLPWKGGRIKLFGKEYEIPRKQVYFSTEEYGYAYSGKSLEIIPWNDEVLAIRNRLQKDFSVEFNACLANLYRDGSDSNGWHSDDEKELGVNPIIASISFGVARDFQLKHKTTSERLVFKLTPGSLLVMGGEMQHYWKHQLPKRKGVYEPRINLTFRKITSPKP
jgi:alkylated DNA repair dioxygenase AlkB